MIKTIPRNNGRPTYGIAKILKEKKKRRKLIAFNLRDDADKN